MLHVIVNILMSLAQTLRRLWQRFTRRPRPIPIPVRSQRTYNSPTSIMLTDLRAPTDPSGRRARW